MSWFDGLGRELHDDIKVVATVTASGNDADMIGGLKRQFRNMFERTAEAGMPLPLQVINQSALPDGQVSVTLQRLWALSKDSVELIGREPKGVREGQFVLMKPTFKFRPGLRYDEVKEVFNLYPSSAFGVPDVITKHLLLVEGSHDLAAFRMLLDEFMPYWEAAIELHQGGGDSLPERWRQLKRDGFRIVTVADGDKESQWKHLTPFWLKPDFEGVDLSALAEAFDQIWSDSIGAVDSDRISLALAEEPGPAATVTRLRNYFRKTTRTFHLLDDNSMKKRLRSVISGIWVRRGTLPKAIADPILYIRQAAFCIDTQEKFA